MSTSNTQTQTSKRKRRKNSQFKMVWKRLARNKLAIFGMCIVIVLVLLAVFADFIAPYDYAYQDLSKAFTYPCKEHPLGTDDYGRDILSRIIYGGRVSLLVGLLSITISLVAGNLLGISAGYFGGLYGEIVMRVMEIFQAVPAFLLAVVISAALGAGVQNTAVAIALGGIPGYARMVRGLVLTIREQEYVEAAKLAGASSWRIMFKHVFPQTLSPTIVNITLSIGGTILAISSLSFIGLGVKPPIPEWGSMLAVGRTYIRDFYPLAIFPGIAIMLTLFGFNLFGDGLRDALDPRLKQ